MPIASIFDPALTTAMLAAIAESGASAVNITAGQQGLINWDTHIADAQLLHQELLKQQLRCAVIQSNAGIDDIDTIVKAVEAAQILDCEFITVPVPSYDGSIPYRSLLGDARGCYQDLNHISSETGIDALIPVSIGSICPNVDAAMRILDGLDPSQVGVLFNPAVCRDEADIQRSIDVLGPFLRVLATSADTSAAARNCAISCLTDQNIFISIETPAAKAKAAAQSIK